MGTQLFTEWKGWLEPAEIKFNRILEENPYYPYIRRDENFFEFRLRYRRAFLAAASAVISLMWMLIMIAFGQEKQEYFIVPIVGLLISFTVMVNYRNLRKYTINRTTNEYTFSEKKNHIYRGALHNIYVRLRRRRSGAGKPYYYPMYSALI
eukprot:Opistho-2@16276